MIQCQDRLRCARAAFNFFYDTQEEQKIPDGTHVRKDFTAHFNKGMISFFSTL